jgi:iron complex outermembrane receptor protein
MLRYSLRGATALALISAVPAFAQDSAGVAADESGDIIVTAAKREQTLREVPISVSVTSDDTIQKSQIVDLIDLQAVVPSLKVTQFETSSQTNFTIRGFGNGNGNIGIESSVGVFIDGVYRSRSASAIADLPEVERIEVLRGPQSTLFGKNVSAGAISIVTKKPQFDWGVRAEATAGNLGLIEANASVTGPISDTLAFRVYGSVNQRDGYFTNLNIGGDVNARDRWAVRGDLLFEPSNSFSVRIIADYNKIDEVCCGAVQLFNGPATQFIGAPPPFGLGRPISDPDRKFERELFYNEVPNNRLVGKGISMQADWQLDFARLTSITSYRKQSAQSTLDIDFSGAEISRRDTDDRIETFTQEVRLVSDSDGPFNWLLGAFYAEEDIDTTRVITYGEDIRAYINGLTGGALDNLEGLQSLVNPGVVPGQTYFQAGQGIFDNYRLKNRSYSIFGQADFEITDGLVLTGGIAYLNDRKKVVSNVILDDPFAELDFLNIPELAFLPLSILDPSAPPGATIPVNLFAELGGFRSRAGAGLQFFAPPVNFPNADEDGILKGDKVTYAARIAYDVSDTLNVYASYSKGWKAGAYNLSSDSRPPDVDGVGRSVDPEDVTVYELGAKASFAGGYVNIAVFDQSIRGFQSNAFVGTGFSLVNAGKQSVRGFEFDAAYAPVRPLLLTASVAYLDPKYDSFTGAPCVPFDTVRCGNGELFRDLSGERPSGIPEISATVSATYSHEFGNGMNGFIRGEYVYASDTQLTDTVPAEFASAEINTVNASIGIATADALEVMLWARNLTNNDYLLSAFNTVVQTGSFSGYPNQPRTYGVTLRKTF